MGRNFPPRDLGKNQGGKRTKIYFLLEHKARIPRR